jgi:hypothetical protein
VIEPIELGFTVGCDPAHAFEVWTSRTALWWPPEHTVSADPDVVVTFEPRAGGRIFERTPAGEEHEWGRILTWEPPGLLRYLWHIRRDRSDATEVEIRFDDDPDGTRVSIVHSGWERLGDGPRWREINTMGWDGVLPSFRDACRLVGSPDDGDEGRT